MTQNAPANAASTLTLPSERQILIERSFHAHRPLVWRMFTDEKMLPKWMGPAQYKMTTSKMDVRKGGTYRWVWDLGGGELVITGRFLEVDPPKRAVTEEFMGDLEGGPGAHNVMTFTEKAGWTTVSLLI